MADSLSDLPPNILTEILIRLPLTTLFSTRCVCKTFLNLTSPNPHFTASHSSIAAQTLAFQFGDSFKPSNLLRSFDPDLDLTKSKPLFHLPKSDTTINLYRGNFREENTFVLVNSCHGLIFFVRRHARNERSLVCIPVTNDGRIRVETETKSMWLGFSPSSNHYKVLRISTSVNAVQIAAQLFVIESTSWKWRSLVEDHVPSGNGGDYSWDSCSAFLSGAMYWLDQSWSDVVFFDYDTERFGEIAMPADFGDEQLGNKHCMSIGVVGGRLCLSYNDFNAQRVDLWVMRKRGDREAWIKEFVVDTVRPVGRPVYGRFKPLQVLRNGEILMLWVSNDFVCYDPRTKRLRFVGCNWLRLTPKAVSFTPSFVPLKDTIPADKVTNRYTRPRVGETDP